MRATGMSRPLDEFGRVVIPKEIRRSFKLNPKDMLEIFIVGDSIILKKPETVCIICGSEEQLETVENKCVCKKCITKIASIEANNQIQI